MKYANLFYFNTLNSAGGIETFFYQLGLKYGKKFDITLFYKQGDPAQVKRLSEVIRVRRYREGQTIRAKRAFVCFSTEIMDNIEADEYIQMLHGDYTSLGVYPMQHPKIQWWIAVSDVVRKAYMTGKGKDSVVSYNPYTPVKPRKVLNLVSATRLTKDKGWNRMLALAEALDKANIPYIWTVYTDNPSKPVQNPNIILRPARLDVVDFIANADYYVQLSDAEGYCYSVVEALCAGTPVIVTDFKVAKEIGVVNGVNGFILPMDMTSIPIDEIYKGLKKFKYSPLPDKWNELLVEADEPTEEADVPVKVRCKKVYLDLEFKRTMNYGEEWEAMPQRADILLDLGVIELVKE